MELFRRKGLVIGLLVLVGVILLGHPPTADPAYSPTGATAIGAPVWGGWVVLM
jgi:hypothetical protein